VAATTVTQNGSDIIFSIWGGSDGAEYYGTSIDGVHFTILGKVELPSGFGTEDILIKDGTITFFGSVGVGNVNWGFGNSVIEEATAPLPANLLPNSPPMVSPDVATVQKGGNVTQAGPGVLANDTDPDHDVLTVTAINGLTTNVGKSIAGTYGTLTLNADGSYTYVEDSRVSIPGQACVADIFDYTASDGHGGSATTTLAFSIQDKAAPGSVSLPFTGPYSVTQGPNDGKFGDHTGSAKWAYDFNLPYDLATHTGTPVLSVGHGHVIDLREYVPDGGLNSSITDSKGNLIPDPTDPSNGTGNDGNYITMQLDDGSYVSYLHLGQNKVSVNVGDEVNTGDILGYTGLTGWRTGPHLHIQFGTQQKTNKTIAGNPTDQANHVHGIFADGSNDKTSPEFFDSLTVHLVGGANNLYTASPALETVVFKTLGDGGYTTDGFQHGQDIIDVSALDANTASAGNQAFSFADMNPSVVPNSITWYEKGGNTTIQADVNGDTIADFTLHLVGTDLHLAATDFKL
jgi:VCBS repeat-containing protein